MTRVEASVWGVWLLSSLVVLVAAREATFKDGIKWAMCGRKLPIYISNYCDYCTRVPGDRTYINLDPGVCVCETVKSFLLWCETFFAAGEVIY